MTLLAGLLAVRLLPARFLAARFLAASFRTMAFLAVGFFICSADEDPLNWQSQLDNFAAGP
jgi:hypothetical protein